MRSKQRDKAKDETVHAVQSEVMYRISQVVLFISVSFIISLFIINSLVPEKQYTYSTGLALRMRQRQEVINNFCDNRTNKTISAPKLNHVLRKMFIDMKHRISWCPVFKAASSMWMKGFAQLGGVLDQRVLRLLEKGFFQWNTVARKAFPFNQEINTTYSNLNQTVRFLIVRHPFERLLSAYRDKIEHREGREYYFKRYSVLIKHIYRQQWQNREEPTFREFLTFLANQAPFDEHWIPITQLCMPCTINYDYIIKTETFVEDNYHMLKELKLDDIVDLRLEENVNPTGKTNINIAKLYYSTIPRRLLESVYKRYEDDFKLFNYTPDEYFAMAK